MIGNCKHEIDSYLNLDLPGQKRCQARDLFLFPRNLARFWNILDIEKDQEGLEVSWQSQYTWSIDNGKSRQMLL